MKNNNYKIFLILLSLLMVGGSILWTSFRIDRENENVVTNIQNESFNQQHYNYIVLDTFVHLLKQAYPTATTNQVQNKLFVIIENSGALTKDFFNGNDKILDLTENDYGFNIAYKSAANKVEATFMIKNNAVPVPNDVMIKLVDKNYNK